MGELAHFQIIFTDSWVKNIQILWSYHDCLVLKVAHEHLPSFKNRGT